MDFKDEEWVPYDGRFLPKSIQERLRSQVTETSDQVPKGHGMVMSRGRKKAVNRVQHIFTEQQLAFLCGAIQRATEKVKNAHVKRPDEIDGEIHTNLRRELQSQAGCAGGFYPRRRKEFYYRFTHEQASLIERMIREMKSQYIKTDPEGLESLRILLLSAQATVNGITEINKQSTDVTKKVADIQKLLEPELFEEEGE